MQLYRTTNRTGMDEQQLIAQSGSAATRKRRNLDQQIDDANNNANSSEADIRLQIADSAHQRAMQVQREEQREHVRRVQDEERRQRDEERTEDRRRADQDREDERCRREDERCRREDERRDENRHREDDRRSRDEESNRNFQLAIVTLISKVVDKVIDK